MAGKNLLVIDFDYFFHDKLNDVHDPMWTLYDWGHSETNPLMHTLLWPSRAAAFYSYDLPLPGLTGLQETFWSRFKFSSHAKLFFAESNVMAIHDDVKRGIDGSVWLFDAHHDCGYSKSLAEIFKRQTWECEDWMIGYALSGRDLHVRYPKWKTRAFEIEPEPTITKALGVKIDRQFDDEQSMSIVFHRVFVCRSGGWVPSWLDPEFDKFIVACPLQTRRDLDEDVGGVRPREIDLEEAKKEGAQLKEWRAEMRKKKSSDA